MADDKGAPSGGGGWGVLEIVLGIILIVGLLDRLSGNKIATNEPTNNVPVVTQDDAANRCGLTLAEPKANANVSRFVTIRGEVGGCNWKTTDRVALYAQLIDAKGKSVSSYLAIPPTGGSGESVVFFETITLTATAAAGTGYLILVPAVPSDTEQSVSVRIPLLFSK